MRTLSRTESLTRDDKNAAKKKARVTKSKAANSVERAKGLQRSGSTKGSKKAAYNTKSKTWRMK